MNLSTASILIVEDQRANIDLLRTILGEEYHLRIATNGSSALRSIALQRPDLVLMDVGLPDISGFDVYAKMLEDGESASIPVIFLTTATTQQDEMTGLELGAVDYIYKPYNPAIIQNRVKNQLELYRYRRKLEALVLKRTQELKETQIGILTTLELATGYRNQETGDHVIRTKELVTLLIEFVAPYFPDELDGELAELMIEASSLHDIGKINVPQEVLNKKMPLTSEEWDLLKQHSADGTAIISPVKSLEDALPIILHHHERYDGTGYPGNLKGEEIPYLARLLSVADSFDAMTSHRPYRAAKSFEEALVELEDCANTQFDPQMVRIFVDILRANSNVFEETKPEKILCKNK